MDIAKRLKILESKNVKPTSIRLLIIDAFQKEGEALSINDLEYKLYPSDRVTIYRTVKTFVKNHILHSITMPDSRVKYALCQHEGQNHHVHPHFTCIKCEKTSCMNETSITLGANYEKYQIKDLLLSVIGYCPDCKN